MQELFRELFRECVGSRFGMLGIAHLCAPPETGTVSGTVSDCSTSRVGIAHCAHPPKQELCQGPCRVAPLAVSGLLIVRIPRNGK